MTHGPLSLHVRRLPSVAAVAVLLGVAVGAVGASAYFTSKGTGSARVTIGTLAAPTISKATPGAGTVALTWTTVPPPGPGAVTYYVSRDGNAPGGNCPTSGSPTGVTTCTDSGLSAGAYHYTVTAKWQSWTATSATTEVTLASGAATHLVLAAITTTPAAGAPDGLTITAKDASNNTVTAYTGDKSLTFTGAGAAPNGTHPTITDKTSGAVSLGTAETITFAGGIASETTPGAGGQSVMKLYKAVTASIVVSDGSIDNGAGLPVTVAPLAASALSLAAVSPVAAGATDNLTITALDTYGNTATGYSGSKSLTFGGANAIGSFHPTVTSSTGTPASFGTAETIGFTNGVASVSGSNNGVMTLYKVETAKITVSDGTVGNGAGLPVTVGPAGASAFTASTPAAQTAGTAFEETLTALDKYGNTATGYTGEHAILFSGPAESPNKTKPSYPVKVSFGEGAGKASITLYDAQTTALTAEEGAIKGASAGFTVNAAPVLLSFTVACPSTLPKNEKAKYTTGVSRAAADAYGNADPKKGQEIAVSLSFTEKGEWKPATLPILASATTTVATATYTAGNGAYTTVLSAQAAGYVSATCTIKVA